jgi:thymidylate kinase
MIDERWIAVTGARGTGKSSFARNLKAALDTAGEQWTLVAGIGAAIEGLGLPVGERATPETISAFLIAHLKRQRRARGAAAVFDRCLLDLYAYSTLVLPGNDSLRRVVREVAESEMRQFSAVFLTRISSDSSSPNESAGFRRSFEQALDRCAADCLIEVHLVDDDAKARALAIEIARRTAR